MEHEKDYSLLRPFDLEAAMSGEKICWYANGDIPKYFIVTPFGNVVANFTEDNKTECMCPCSNFRMAPLAWVEGKPVYKGDVLYSSFFKGMQECKDGLFEVTGIDENGQFKASKISRHHRTKYESCSWPKTPKTKKVKMLCYHTGINLEWFDESAHVLKEFKRVPSEDKEVEVEL